MDIPKLNCLFHYKLNDAKYSEIIQIYTRSINRIREAKVLREEKGGRNHHQEQCDSIPEVIDNNVHGVHLEPCYKKFTHIISEALTETNQPHADPRKSIRLSSPTAQIEMSIHPKTCYFCKKDIVKYKSKIRRLITIATDQASNTTIESAKTMNDKSTYYEIKDIDLIAKEFKYHEHCYREFTRVPKSTKTATTQNQGDYNNVREIVEMCVLQQNQAISLANIHAAYGLEPDDTRYRNKLKERIQNEFKDKILFMKVNHNTPEIVINSKALDSHAVLNDAKGLVKEAAIILRKEIQDYLRNMDEVQWPPDIRKLPKEEDLTMLTTMFLENLLKNEEKPLTENLNRVVLHLILLHPSVARKGNNSKALFTSPWFTQSYRAKKCGGNFT